MSAASSPARFRGTAVGAFSAALATTAHGLAAGTGPSGGSVALLAVLAGGLGAVVTATERAARPVALIGFLAAGQLAGHLVLGVGAHTHTPTSGAPLPGSVMLAAHVVAVVAGALLVAAAERCYATLSSVLRATGAAPHASAHRRATTALPHPDHPLLRALLIAASISHRGPPVTVAR